MENPLIITFHDMHHNSELETLVKEKFDKLKTENPYVTKCHVTIEKQSKHHKKGNMACVRFDLKISRFEDIILSEPCEETVVAIKSAIIKVFKQGIDMAREQKKHRIETKRVAVELPEAE